MKRNTEIKKDIIEKKNKIKERFGELLEDLEKTRGIDSKSWDLFEEKENVFVKNLRNNNGLVEKNSGIMTTLYILRCIKNEDKKVLNNELKIYYNMKTKEIEHVSMGSFTQESEECEWKMGTGRMSI